MTATEQQRIGQEKTGLVEMAWDPITRIVGSLGIYTKIDFAEKKVVECYSTSSVFRGYSIFMKGKDPRDAHFITSRICGICGDNHATCSVYNQNMAYGIAPPHLGEWIINLGESAEYMFDHNIFQENLVGVDYCEKMVRETNPGVLDQANRTPAPHADEHGYKTIGDIMRALNPLEGEFYREALQVSRYTREMFCLMEGRHVHPSTLYPGGVGTVATVQLFTDYLTRLMKYVEFCKKIVPLHDDLFDFFYEALPGYEEVGRRRVLLGCWGSLNDPEYCDFKYENMTNWGRKMFVTPGVVVDGKLVTNDLVDINLGIRILLGSSYYDDWADQKPFVTHDPLGNPVDQRHPWNQHTIPQPQKRDFADKYSWVMSPRWYDGKDYLALDTGGGPIARLWATALSGLVDCGYVKATGDSVVINLPTTVGKPEKTFVWRIPHDKQGRPLSNAIERNRARTYFQAYAAALALYFTEKAMGEVRAGHTKTWTPFKVPKEAISCGFTEAVRGVLSHHMVIRNGKIANYHPYPPTPWNGSVRDSYGTPGPYEDAVQNTPIFEENPPDNFKGIDIMRAVRSFDPCLPCGVHMYLGNGKTLQKLHTPTAFTGSA
ncbi:nickel-dependent hydrogenase large subunit [Planosporangium mesophilum]|uniref:Hydrogenase large subunit n=1 Tax=Planosporangium mesophilum TaxID=689768 RepID=A0A8J3TCH1_9ACTN|nr:nickel-dependent hydrogenase large subunit [Planosporangium mesophilum]NJC82746.1 nickel-dependent hydrogenase large subunit [Planosporangium mesophilum]GII23784.1 hydrogenase large subunit [Planosporangium mesophilum]